MSESVIQSFVWHDGKCYFVSTIERDSSSPYGPPRYNETMAWKYDWEKNERGEMLPIQEGDNRGSIEGHLHVCRCLHERGESWVYETKSE